MVTVAHAFELAIGRRSVLAYWLNQAAIGMSVEVEAGSQVNLYGNSVSLRTLADLLDAVSRDGTVAFLSRHEPDGADLVCFRGTDTPLDFPAYRKMRRTLASPRTGQAVSLQMRPESESQRTEDTWRHQNLITVRTLDHAVLLGGSELGLRLCALDCSFLAESDKTNHTHWDHPYWLGTSKSVEMIIRNLDHD